MTDTPYPLLFSEWKIRNTTIPEQGRVRTDLPDVGRGSARRRLHRPGCRVLRGAREGRRRDDHHRWHDHRPGVALLRVQLPGALERRAGRGAREGRRCSSPARLQARRAALHVGLRATPVLKKDPAYDVDAEWYLVAPSQVPPGEYPNAPMPKELEEHEIEILLQAYADAAWRAVAAGLDGVEFHMSHGYLPWQFLSPLYNHRSDGWGGSYENRLRFPRRGAPPDPRRDRRPSRSSATGSTRPRSGPAISRWTT